MIKFKSTWQKMEDKPFLEEQEDKVSMVEPCPDMSIPRLLKLMPEGSLDTFFEGYDDDVDTDAILERDFAYEDDKADACDVFAENETLKQLDLVEKAQSIEKEKSSAGDVPQQQSQADTTLPPKAE